MSTDDEMSTLMAANGQISRLLGVSQLLPGSETAPKQHTLTTLLMLASR